MIKKKEEVWQNKVIKKEFQEVREHILTLSL